jgi:hypothetical protein
MRLFVPATTYGILLTVRIGVPILIGPFLRLIGVGRIEYALVPSRHQTPAMSPAYRTAYAFIS